MARFAVPEGLVVLDTSAVVPWFFTDEPSRTVAIVVRSEVRDEPERFVVPHLFYSELVHVLARKSGRDEAFVRAAFQLVVALGIRTVGLSARAMERAAHWACHGLSGYDATFGALAEDLGAVWLTADARAARALGEHATRLA